MCVKVTQQFFTVKYIACNLKESHSFSLLIDYSVTNIIKKGKYVMITFTVV